MQDIHSIGGGGGGGRLFGGGSGGAAGDRRLRPQHHNPHHVNHSSSQAMKCPRCESINTKFCYYNNYNLSQPRHFCKSCRRYWTKGGVLRNVPIGGGCRKTKRSKHKQSSSSAPAAAAASTPAPAQQVEEPPVVVDQRKSPNSQSSSESSSLTGTANTTVAAEAVSISHSSTSVAFSRNNSSNNHSVLNRIGESKLFAGRSNLNPSSFETAPLLEQGAECGIFPEMGSFTSLISSTSETMSFGFGGDDLLRATAPAEPRGQGESENQQWKMQSMGLIDRTVDDQVPALESGRSGGGGGGFGSLDWEEPGVGGGGGGGLFDLPSAVDQGGYWSRSQWTTSDQDPTGLYF